MTANDEKLMRRARAAFHAAADEVDAVTAAKLAAMRRRAVELAETPAPAWRGALVPAGAFAALVVVGLGLALWTRQPLPPEAPAVEAFELLLSEDDLALYEEDPEFLEWVGEQTDAG
jgi:hypothetical protein